MDFMKKLEGELDSQYNVNITENGALGYKTTKSNLLNINFKTSSYRNMQESAIKNDFIKAYVEDKLSAIKWLFFARDIRGGMGEKRLFRVCIQALMKYEPKVVVKVLNLISEYGSYADLLEIYSKATVKEVKDEIINIIKNQLSEDMTNSVNGNPISLLAKWMPSNNTSSVESRRLSSKLIKKLGISQKEYRMMLANLRKHLDVIEIKMAAKEWNEIDYNKVPSKANIIYKNAFMRNDTLRRKAYLFRLETGKEDVKINSSTLFPHDIVSRYDYNSPKDVTLEEMWKSLPNYLEGTNKNILFVRDGSGSMLYEKVANSKVSALDIATSLAIYFAEKLPGEFKDKFITFSSNPSLIDISKQTTLKDKLARIYKEDDCSNTDIEVVFNLVLSIAIKNNMESKDLPDTIVIASDMEFDGATTKRCNQRLFDGIFESFKEHGYKMPRLVFWNICSRTGTIPVKENKAGVVLVSGFSPVITKMILSSEVDPLKILLESINTERYQAVENAVKDIL